MPDSPRTPAAPTSSGQSVARKGAGKPIENALSANASDGVQGATGHPADLLYERMQELFGTGENELFVLEWPARALDETTYAYDVSSVYSELTKPQAVSEAEFLLSDGLIDVSPIVAGPNGSQLSIVMKEALEQLVPAYTESNKAFQQDREKLRAWLLEPATATYLDDKEQPQTLQMPRVDIYDVLNGRYLEARTAWDREKTERLEEAEKSTDPDALDRYAKWLAEEAKTREADLERKFADLVIQGYYHEVRAAVATLDVGTAGEQLEQAKMSMRASEVSSLDETESVYPVQFSPQDWFKGLSTNFQPADLLLDPTVLESELLQKKQQIASLEGQITFLESTHTGDEKELKAAVEKARDELNSALTSLTGQYASNVLTVARMYFGTFSDNPKEATKEGLDKALEKAKVESGLTEAQWKQLSEGFMSVNKAQQTLTTAGEKLVELQAAEMAAKTTNPEQLVAALKAQVGELQQQVSHLEEMLFSPEAQARLQALASAKEGVVTYEPKKDPNWNAKEKTYTPLPTPMPAPGDWFDVTFSFAQHSEKQSSEAQASASQTSWDVDVFFGSASGTSQSSESKSVAEMSTSKLAIKLGFRAMKVTIDRGGWFEPNLFGLSKEMYYLGDPSKHVLISKGPAKPFTLPANPANAKKEFAELRTAILPAYPISFLVVKDMTIHIEAKDETLAREAAAQASSSSYSGGIFCFSVSGSSSSSSSSSKASSCAIGEDIIIKIPGPQILGWFLEYVAADGSTPYQAMPSGFLPTSAGELLRRAAAAELTAAPEAALTASTPAAALAQAVRSEAEPGLRGEAAAAPQDGAGSERQPVTAPGGNGSHQA